VASALCKLSGGAGPRCPPHGASIHTMAQRDRAGLMSPPAGLSHTQHPVSAVRGRTAVGSGRRVLHQAGSRLLVAARRHFSTGRYLSERWQRAGRRAPMDAAVLYNAVSPSRTTCEPYLTLTLTPCPPAVLDQRVRQPAQSSRLSAGRAQTCSTQPAGVSLPTPSPTNAAERTTRCAHRHTQPCHQC